MTGRHEDNEQKTDMTNIIWPGHIFMYQYMHDWVKEYQRWKKVVLVKTKWKLVH